MKSNKNKKIIIKFRGKHFILETEKLLNNENFTDKLLLLDILDYLIDFTKESFHILVGTSIDLMSNLLKIIKANNKLLQNKILYLIKKWENKFKSKKKYWPIFSETYNSLIFKGTKFPNSSIEYTKYLKSSNVKKTEKQIIKNYVNETEKEEIEIQTSIKFGEVFIDLNPDNYDEKYFKFVSELSILLDNMKLANVRKKISN
jgi:hypothetical protein